MVRDHDWKRVTEFLGELSLEYGAAVTRDAVMIIVEVTLDEELHCTDRTSNMMVGYTLKMLGKFSWVIVGWLKKKNS